MSAWVAQSPTTFTDQRRRWTQESGLVQQNVRAYRGVITRRGEDGRQEFDRCPHAHNKQSAARKCAEAAARRLNRTMR